MTGAVLRRAGRIGRGSRGEGRRWWCLLEWARRSYGAMLANGLMCGEVPIAAEPLVARVRARAHVPGAGHWHRVRVGLVREKLFSKLHDEV